MAPNSSHPPTISRPQAADRPEFITPTDDFEDRAPRPARIHHTHRRSFPNGPKTAAPTRSGLAAQHIAEPHRTHAYVHDLEPSPLNQPTQRDQVAIRHLGPGERVDQVPSNSVARRVEVDHEQPPTRHQHAMGLSNGNRTLVGIDVMHGQSRGHHVNALVSEGERFGGVHGIPGSSASRCAKRTRPYPRMDRYRSPAHGGRHESRARG